VDPPVRPRAPRRQALLFLIATLVPCVVLLALGLRLMAQERQLDDQRSVERRLLLVVQVRQELLSRLDGIKLRELTRAVASADKEPLGREPQAAVVFVGELVDGRVRLPWEGHPHAEMFRKSLEDPTFAREIRQAETAELVARDYELAVRYYQAAIAAARQPAQQTYARLLLARALGKRGRRDESRAAYEAVLSSPADLVDEHGVPLALYAAPPLLDAGFRRQEILERVRDATSADRWPSPAALYLIRDLLRRLTLDSSDLAARIAVLLHDSEQAEALQRDSARLLAIAGSREPVWMAYGDPVWLASVASPGKHGLVVVVRAGEVLAGMNAGAPQRYLALGTETTGETLGDGFPGLRVVLPAQQATGGNSRLTLLGFALTLALALTLLSGYLLRRDVQRDLRLAEMRSQFVSSVTHELKTPLTAIRMFTETLRLDEEVDHQTRSEYLDTILHESERLSRLVDNVLDFGKIERGKKIYRFEPVQLADVVEDAARAIQYPIEQAGFTLDLDINHALPPVAADADAMQQAILNLLTNAMKYSGDSRQIRLGLDRRNGHARIQVADQGIGIAPADQGRVFERFYRATTAENQHTPGTGLGLTLVAHIVSAHGGDVDVESTPGMGSTFTIRLPLPDADLNTAADTRSRL
jgi:signal transduction histidine kinase